ncbi:MAG: hypothetical protein AAGG81_09205 [Chlamydiota bacterium]
MGETKITNQPFTGKVNTFESHLKNIDDDVKKVDTSPVNAQQPIVEEQIPEYIPASSDDNVDDSTSSSKGSIIKELFKKMWTFFVPNAEKEENQVAESKKIDQSMQAIGSRPVLEKPKIGPATGTESLVAALEKVKDSKLVQPVTNNEETSSRSTFGELNESELDKLTFDMHHNQIDIRKKASVTLKDNIIQDTRDKKRLMNEYLDLLEEARQKGKNSKIFNWISIGAGVIGGALAVGGLVALILGTGGTAVSIIAAFGGIAAIASGGTEIGSSVFKYLQNQAQGDAFVTREKGNMKKDDIMAKLQNMEENDNSITQLWSSLGQLLRKAPSNMFR